MHVWIVLAAFALIAVAPYMGSAPPRSDLTQIAEEWSDLDQAEDVDDEA